MILAAGGTVIGGVYVMTHLEKAPITGRTRFMAVSPEMEMSMTKDVWEQLKQELKPQTLPASDKRAKMVKEVSLPIIQAANLPDVQWEIIVVEKDEPNAFALPGGKICVFTGILPVAKDHDGLATVIAHEIGHVVARHHAENWTLAQFLTYANYGLQLLVGDVVSPQIIAAFMQYGVSMPFNRTNETEADHIGLLLMAKACFDPEVAPGLWERMADLHKESSVSQYLSTHPASKNRAAYLKDKMPEAEKMREASHCSALHFRRSDFANHQRAQDDEQEQRGFW